MVVEDAAVAQIELILASDDSKQTQQLLTDLQASRYTYSFVCLFVREALLEAACRRILRNAGNTPSVIVINHAFAGPDCEALLQLARNASPIAAVECVVTDPPSDSMARAKLIRLGARLFQGERHSELMLLTLH
jgi:hypothetical protein